MICPGESRWNTRTPDGLGSLRLERISVSAVSAEAWGPGADWMMQQAPRLLGAEDDVSGFRYLSLRIGQASGDPANDLRIQIRNAEEWSAEVRLTDHGVLAQPLDMCFIQAPPVCQPRTHMATIRIPLSAFGGHDNVDFVRLRFRGDSTVDTFIIDNLEFSESVQGPWSGTI